MVPPPANPSTLSKRFQPGASEKSRLEILPHVWLDHRRGIFLEKEGVLAVSDLHLGYAWAHRFNGQLMPLQPEGLCERLAELCSFYQPKTVAVLGDIVHRAVPIPEIIFELEHLTAAVSGASFQLILGNHDRGLRKLFQPGCQVELLDSVQAGPYFLFHGNEAIPPANSVIVMGHEHPAISLGDGVRSAKFPCFLASKRLLVLPAFSTWAAGSDVRFHPFMSPLARATRFEQAVAILNGKLLSIPL